MVARENQCVMALTPVKLPRLIRWTALWPGLYTPATATKPIDEPPRDTCRNSPAMPRVTVHPPMSAGLNGPSEAVKGGCRGVWWDSNRARVRVRVCVCARDVKLCACAPRGLPIARVPGSGLEDLCAPHDGVEWENGRSLVQASWDFAVRVIYVWMREQWCNI